MDFWEIFRFSGAFSASLLGSLSGSPLGKPRKSLFSHFSVTFNVSGFGGSHIRAKKKHKLFVAENGPCGTPFLFKPFWSVSVTRPRPSTAGTFWKKFRKNSEKTPRNALRAFPGIPFESTAGTPKPYHSRHLKPPDHFQTSLPLSTAGDASFSEVVRERASQSWSWNSKQY